MGRGKRKTRAGATPSRRQFIQRAGGTALMLTTVPLLPACGGGHDGNLLPTPPGTGTFRHGVASGDPLSDRVILWTRVTPATAGAVTLDCVVATDTALANIVSQTSVTTDATRDYTVKNDVTGLQPNTTYYYRFSLAGTHSPIGRTRTMPAGAASRLRMAVVSCADIAMGFFNAYRRVAERADLDLVVHLGDYIYEYGDAAGNFRAVEPPVEILTLADYRTRHAQYKRDADLQEVHRQHPMIAIWDDHDIASNANVSGSQNHTEGLEGTWANRVSAAVQAFHEWMPVRMVDPANPRKNYRNFAYGNLVDLLMLEERVQARSPQAPPNATLSNTFRQRDQFLDPSREMLGSEEQDWLATRLRTSTARWKFIAQGVMFAQLKIQGQTNAEGGGLYVNNDQWDGYQPARDRIFAVLKGDATTPAVDNVVFVTGDAHSSWASDLSPDPNNGDAYDKSTGNGSHAVEFVGTSVTSEMVLDTHGLLESTLRSINPHLKYIDLSERGYMLIDADPTRVVAEWWFVDTVETPNNGQSFATAYQVAHGTNRLVATGVTNPRANPPALAPG
jgi:alkaline phosphatase D